ncbi:DUF3043 domain-containing protein [Pseudonocardia broussonetiae]|uniref:DUF3043 domain-containing protein n=1 Tax=Pseudonocardia broussonetiae TaxID=2736640 RepID=A0A6M6JMG8_9PSEU|nr:DUF3043 domain-containing protein [Pseudonocardia broussonetiae]QJY47619.1 DUF3043 domain-containing protein [Pseudonocardia broussonetiae]
MRFLRSKPADDATDDASSGAPTTGPETVRVGGKGRPTPKRREAETKRRGPAPPPPRTQREAAKLARANRPDKSVRRAEAAERRERMAAGDEKFLMPRDRGPVKAFVRDVVDSRPHLMGLFMPLAIIVVLSLLVPIPQVQSYLSLFSLIALTTMIIEGIFLGATITKKARARFPDEKISGLGTGWYAFTRASQLRRLRIPKPRVERGANP